MFSVWASLASGKRAPIAEASFYLRACNAHVRYARIDWLRCVIRRLRARVCVCRVCVCAIVHARVYISRRVCVCVCVCVYGLETRKELDLRRVGLRHLCVRPP